MANLPACASTGALRLRITCQVTTSTGNCHTSWLAVKDRFRLRRCHRRSHRHFLHLFFHPSDWYLFVSHSTTDGRKMAAAGDMCPECPGHPHTSSIIPQSSPEGGENALKRRMLHEPVRNSMKHHLLRRGNRLSSTDFGRREEEVRSRGCFRPEAGVAVLLPCDSPGAH